MVSRRKAPDKNHPKKLPSAIDKDFNRQDLGATKQALPELAPDEQGYEIQGYYASVRFARGAGADKHMFGVTCCAFARDAVGKPYLTAEGIPIEGSFTASCQKKDLVGNPDKVSEMRAIALDGALRDMVAHIAENVAFESLKM